VTIRSDVPLAPYCTLGVGGPARWLADAETDDELLSAVRFARARNAPFFLLGGGSNLLVSDAGFPGVVIRVAGLGRMELRRLTGHVTIDADAGVVWDSLVLLALQKNLAGIECLAGIPGSVGGTPVQNVGAYGQEVASTITRVHAIDLEAEKPVELTAAECGFAYRRSIFNSTQRGRYAITRVVYALAPDGAPHIAYRDIKQFFAENGYEQPTLLQTAYAVRSIRARKGMLLSPDDPDSRSAGSFFKNPIVSAEIVPRLAAIKGCRTEEVPQFPAGDVSVGTDAGADFASAANAENAQGREGDPHKLAKLSAAWLIELAGFHKGHVMGRAGLSTKHVLAIVNRGGATAAEIVALRDAVIDAVHATTGIRLEQEPVLLGFPSVGKA